MRHTFLMKSYNSTRVSSSVKSTKASLLIAAIPISKNNETFLPLQIRLLQLGVYTIICLTSFVALNDSLGGFLRQIV